MLASRRCYVSEIAEVLDIGQKAILEHLELMEEAGILEATHRRIDKGRPRKYFTISKKFRLEVSLISKELNIDVEFEENDEKSKTEDEVLAAGKNRDETFSKIFGNADDVFDEFPKLREIVDRVLSEDKDGISDELKRELYTEKRKLEKAKKILDEIFEIIER